MGCFDSGAALEAVCLPDMDRRTRSDLGAPVSVARVGVEDGMELPGLVVGEVDDDAPKGGCSLDVGIAESRCGEKDRELKRIVGIQMREHGKEHGKCISWNEEQVGQYWILTSDSTSDSYTSVYDHVRSHCFIQVLIISAPALYCIF